MKPGSKTSEYGAALGGAGLMLVIELIPQLGLSAEGVFWIVIAYITSRTLVKVITPFAAARGTTTSEAKR